MLSAISVVAAMSSLGACAHAPSANEEMEVTAVAEVVPTMPGCGTIFFGTPVTFRVVSGPRTLKGQRVEAVVPCLELYPEFYVVGRSYDLQLTTHNVYEIEVWPKQSTAQTQLFLKAATDLDTGKSNSWADMTTRRGY
jgi:hypothetical protein